MHDCESTLIAADSMRVQVLQGVTHTRAWQKHASRFTQAVLQQIALFPTSERQPIADDLASFIERTRTAIRESGEGFPRLECWNTRGALSLNLALRPLPPTSSTIRLRLATETGNTANCASTPRDIKGPNIPEYARLNTQLGAEALFTSDDGTVIEGASVSLLVWNDSTLFRVPRADTAEGIGLERVASVTEQLVCELVQDMGWQVNSRRTHFSELPQCETWALNALHGIRPVTHLGDDPLPAPDTNRLEQIQTALAAMVEPL